MKNYLIRHGIVPLMALSALSLPAHGQSETQPMDHAAMGHASVQEQEKEKPVDHSAMQHGTAAGKQDTPPASPPAAAKPEHEAMGHMPMGQPSTMQQAAPSTPAGQGAMNHSGMAHGTAQEESAMPPMTAHQNMGPQGTRSNTNAPPTAEHAGMDHQNMQRGGMDMGAMQMGPMQGGKAPPDARDPAAYNEGARAAGLPGNAMADMAPFGRIMLDKLEAVSGDGERGQNIETEAWYGGDYNKAWLKADGERRSGQLEAMRTELLWDRTFSPFWSTQLGMRHDTGGGPSRSWLAAGVRGLAPYWFDVEATAYWRAGGEFAGRVQVAYELLFTQRVILEPELELNVQNRSDRLRGMGTGLTNAEFGLRLRYEIRRQFAPYIGVTWSRKFGSTATLARESGDDRKTLQAVIGLRVWY